MDQVWGTFGGRWYVTAFAVAYVFFGWKLLGWKRLGVYSLIAFAVAVASENLSVHVGIPYTRYAFNEAMRGRELWIGDVPLMVPASYTFVMFFAFFAGRAVAAGPWKRVPASRFGALALGVLFATWSTWILDPMSQRGASFYLGDLFHYEGDGFWFGLPLASQIGWFAVSLLLCGVLAFMVRGDTQLPERPLANPQVGALAVFAIEVTHLSVVGLVIGEHTLGAAGLLVWVPVAVVVAVLWPQLKPQDIDIRDELGILERELEDGMVGESGA